MSLYRLKRLVNKYSVNCELITLSKGNWSAGEWQEGEEMRTPLRCAIVPITERRIYSSGGNYKAGDCDIISLTPIDTENDAHIQYKGKTYKIEQGTDYSDYSDVYAYVGRRASSFDKSIRNTEDADQRA